MTKLEQFRDLLLKWNQRINLTAASTPSEIEEHIADCLALVPHVPDVGRLLDVGSGGGLPAIVIAIAKPDLAVVALEPTAKKHAFLRTAARELGLPRFDPRAERWEDHGIRGYDVATSRATMDLAVWLEVGARFVRPGGVVLGMEGREQIRLPGSTERRPYAAGDKTRAILIKSV
jgi:16S rRNA (guanine527-N7)-methyltransferase